MFILLLLLILLIPSSLAQYISQEYYIDNACSQSYLQTIDLANNLCISSLYVDTSYIASCFPGSNYTYISCDTKECISSCETTSTLPFTCMKRVYDYISMECITSIPNQPTGTYSIKTYSNTNTCNEKLVSTSIYTLDVCSTYGNSYTKYLCDDKYVYQYVCNDNSCKSCSTPTVLWNTECQATDMDSIEVICVPSISTTSSTSEGIRNLPLVLSSIAIIAVIVWYFT